MKVLYVYQISSTTIVDYALLILIL